MEIESYMSIFMSAHEISNFMSYPACVMSGCPNPTSKVFALPTR